MLEKICEQSVAIMDRSVKNFDYQDKRKYANFLAQSFYYVSHSTRFLAFAAGLMGPDDAKYFTRYINHITEEKGHDLIAKKDLEALGFSINEFPELPITKMLWESQYYKIQHVDPLSLMGYILPLEVMSAQTFPVFLKNLREMYDEKSVRFVRIHAEEDPDHVKKAFDVINELSEYRIKDIEKNVEQTAIAYAMMMDTISGSTL